MKVNGMPAFTRFGSSFSGSDSSRLTVCLVVSSLKRTSVSMASLLVARNAAGISRGRSSSVRA